MKVPPRTGPQPQVPVTPEVKPFAVTEAGQVGGFVDIVPVNQPVNRWRGQMDIPSRPADPLPSWLGAPFRKHGIILSPDPNVPWKAKDVFNPAAIVHNGQVHLFPRCEDVPKPGERWTSRVGHYVSDDGIKFRPAADPDVPVISPTESYEMPGGCEDPRVVQLDNGKFVMTYTAFDGKTARLALAVSDDLVTWTKKGLVFPDDALMANPAFKAVHGQPWTKSGGIVPEKINGQYVMYFGENEIFMATSKDGVKWDFATDAKPIIGRRPGFFDQGLVEPGPPPFVDDEGIHLLYHGDGPPLGYQLGEAVFDKNDPTRVIRRSSSTLLKPDQDYEVKGQVGAVIFAEGLARLGDNWFLYYGAADGQVAVASAPAPKTQSPLATRLSAPRRT